MARKCMGYTVKLLTIKESPDGLHINDNDLIFISIGRNLRTLIAPL